MALLHSNEPIGESMRRWFGLSGAAALTLLAWLCSTRVPGLAAGIFFAALFMGVGYYAVPRWQDRIIRGWQIAVFPIAFVVGHVLLMIVFGLVLTPMAIVARWLGYDPLKLRHDDSRVTMWVDRDDSETVPDRAFRQF